MRSCRQAHRMVHREDEEGKEKIQRSGEMWRGAHRVVHGVEKDVTERRRGWMWRHAHRVVHRVEKDVNERSRALAPTWVDVEAGIQRGLPH